MTVLKTSMLAYNGYSIYSNLNIENYILYCKSKEHNTHYTHHFLLCIPPPKMKIQNSKMHLWFYIYIYSLYIIYIPIIYIIYIYKIYIHFRHFQINLHYYLQKKFIARILKEWKSDKQKNFFSQSSLSVVQLNFPLLVVTKMIIKANNFA